MNALGTLFPPAPIDPTPYDIPAEDAALRMYPAFLSPEDADRLFNHLLVEADWRQREIEVGGRTCRMRRLTDYYGDFAYKYSGLCMEAKPWLPALLDLRSQVQIETGFDGNGALLNYYEDGLHGIDWHQDNEPALGLDPVVASLSLGAERLFELRHINHSDRAPLGIVLIPGSLLLMAGKTQTYWKHRIRPTSLPVGKRINITLRRHLF